MLTTVVRIGTLLAPRRSLNKIRCFLTLGPAPARKDDQPESAWVRFLLVLVRIRHVKHADG
jgi:hypothetical protein